MPTRVIAIIVRSTFRANSCVLSTLLEVHQSAVSSTQDRYEWMHKDIGQVFEDSHSH